MAYRIGFCPQSGEKIMAQDTDGKWNAFRPSFRQVLLIFADGHRIKCPLSASSLEAPRLSDIFTELTAEGSQAADDATLRGIAARGVPVSIQEVKEKYTIEDYALKDISSAFF